MDLRSNRKRCECECHGPAWSTWEADLWVQKEGSPTRLISMVGSFGSDSTDHKGVDRDIGALVCFECTDMDGSGLQICRKYGAILHL